MDYSTLDILRLFILAVVMALILRGIIRNVTFVLILVFIDFIVAYKTVDLKLLAMTASYAVFEVGLCLLKLLEFIVVRAFVVFAAVGIFLALLKKAFDGATKKGVDLPSIIFKIPRKCQQKIFLWKRNLIVCPATPVDTDPKFRLQTYTENYNWNFPATVLANEGFTFHGDHIQCFGCERQYNEHDLPMSVEDRHEQTCTYSRQQHENYGASFLGDSATRETADSSVPPQPDEVLTLNTSPESTAADGDVTVNVPDSADSVPSVQESHPQGE